MSRHAVITPAQKANAEGSGTGTVSAASDPVSSPSNRACGSPRTRLTDVLRRRHSAFPRQSRKGRGGMTIRWRPARQVLRLHFHWRPGINRTHPLSRPGARFHPSTRSRMVAIPR